MEKENLIKVSNKTINDIINLDVVTPSIFLGVFSKYANLYHLDISDEAVKTDKLLNEKISFFTELQDKTTDNANKLSKTTSKAIDAIKNKDEDILNEVVKESESLKNEIEKLKEAVYKDDLTKTYNRKWLNEHLLNEELPTFKDRGHLAVIDLNFFKQINDNYGHTIGDKVLIFIANELKKLKGDVIRYGGDEFIIVFSAKENENDIYTKMNMLRNYIIKKQLKIKNISFKTSFSFGITKFNKNSDVTEIINKADKEMYEDKIQIKRKLKNNTY